MENCADLNKIFDRFREGMGVIGKKMIKTAEVYYKQPNIEEFLEYFEAAGNSELSEYQKALAESLIDYRVKHFSGGLGGGRTFVVNAVRAYFLSRYPVEQSMSREI